ncbi:Non-structural maintenance of chromosome element 4 [Rhynchospora pubera]|uniref:Non-structural maintenance of chromosomes element 4 n=1 Tax=Rhynchospora pubera TaxID=906938 RepID=A0AAV8H3E1_9POAL|nr:Non-structural maintenance of chromosome element 4 [Rhynchospora pubera]
MDNASESRGRQQGLMERRLLRYKYLSVKSQISEDVGNVDSNKLSMVIRELENLHQNVQRPREQVSDAETLLDIANSLVTSARSLRNGPTPSDFVDGLIRKFGVPRIYNSTKYLSKASWARIGMSVSQIFMRGHGYCTMNGPMDAEVKPRRSIARRKRTRPTQTSRPEDAVASALNWFIWKVYSLVIISSVSSMIGNRDGNPTKRTDTDRNMLTMFAILRKHKQAKLEYLVLNRHSLAQTVENVFALSFLVKDGRAQITVDKNGFHFVSLRNAPAAAAITSGDVCFSHFVFRFDVKDWKAMREMVAPGAELMPHRVSSLNYATLAPNTGQANSGPSNSEQYATLAYNISEDNSDSLNPLKYATLASNISEDNSDSFNLLKYATLASNINGVSPGSSNLVTCALLPDPCQVNTRPSATGSTSTPIKTLTRNRGLIMRENSVMNDSQNRSAVSEVLFYRRKFRRLDSASNDSQKGSSDREVLFYRRKFRRLDSASNDSQKRSSDREVLFYRRKFRHLDDSTT